MHLVILRIAFLLLAAVSVGLPMYALAQLAPGDTGGNAPGPLGGQARIESRSAIGDRQSVQEPAGGDGVNADIVPRNNEDVVVPQDLVPQDQSLPSMPTVPPPDVDTSPLQQPLTLGPFEATGATQAAQAPGQPASSQAATQAAAPQEVTQFAAQDTQAVLQQLQAQQQLLEERSAILKEREAVLEAREAYLNERTQYLQNREQEQAAEQQLLQDQAAAAAAQADQVTVGEFFNGEAARYAEQWGNQPDQFAPGPESGSFAPGHDDGNFNPGPVDTKRPFFTTVNPPEPP